MMPLRPYPAALLRKEGERVLVVADLHIGWEVALADKGFFIPSRTEKMVARMMRIIKRYKPTELILLGDVKHTIARADLSEWKDIPEFLEKIIKEVPDVKVIPGNHDGNLAPLLPESVEILPVSGINLWGEFGLFHGHSWPDPSLLECPLLITGHMHPLVTFKDASGFRITHRVWIRSPCNGDKLATSLLKHLGIKIEGDVKLTMNRLYGFTPKTNSLMIMPSFNEFLGGQSVNSRRTYRGDSRRFIGPVLRSKCANMERAEVFMLDGTFLGTIRQLRGFA